MDNMSEPGPMTPGNAGGGVGRAVIGLGTAATLGAGAALAAGGPPVWGWVGVGGGLVVAVLGGLLVRWGNQHERDGFVPYTVEDDTTDVRTVAV